MVSLRRRKLMTNPLYTPYCDQISTAIRKEGYWNDDTLPSWLLGAANKIPDKAFIEMAGRKSVTFAELRERSIRFANGLLSRGCKKGDVVAIQLYNCPDFLTAYFGISWFGGIAAPLHMPLRDAEVEPLLRYSCAKAVVCAPKSASYEGAEMFERLRSRLPDLDQVIVADAEEEPELGVSMATLIDSEPAAPAASLPQPEDPVLLCFTSGTSSAPKGVMRDYQTLTANARIYTGMMELDASHRAMIVSPLTHVYGLEGVNGALYRGATIIPIERYEPLSFAENLEAFAPTIVYCAPAHVAASLKENAFAGRDLGSVRDVIVAGALCPPHVAKSMDELLPNGRVGSLFGMTEILIATQTPPDGSPAIRHNSVGKPLPGVEARIVDDEGRPLGEGQPGELQLRGVCLMSSYMNNPDANARAFTADGWFKTADLAEWVEDGNIAIRGRLSDVINRGGVKINPIDVENIIVQHEKIRDAALIPVQDDILGERICAAVTLVPGAQIDLDEILNYLAGKSVSKNRWPERLVVLEEMPMTPTKKIIKGKVREIVDNVVEFELAQRN